MNHSNPDNDVSRRAFLQLALGWLAGGFAAIAAGAGALRFLIPNVLFEPGQRFKLSKPEDYADGSVTFMDEERVFVIRKGNTFRCMSAVCTHLGCTVNRAAQGYHCPCHGSVFDEQGDRKAGPAPRGLAWFSVTLSKDNRLVVDKGELVSSEKYLVI